MKLQDVTGLLLSLADRGVFGDLRPPFDVARVERNTQDDGFASQLDFFSVKGIEDHRRVDVVVKRLPKLEELRDIFNSPAQFHNEKLIYTEFLPCIGPHAWDYFPKAYHCSVSGSPMDVMILEDLKQLGYALADSKLFLDEHHCRLVVRKLGEFHGKVLKFKAQDREKFNDIARRLKEIRIMSTTDQQFSSMIRASMLRGVNALLKEMDAPPGDLIKLKDCIEKINLKSIMECLIKPEDPFGLVVHGDFCRNNMMFKYDSDKRPVDVKFFDLQCSEYNNPAVDLSFFLYMHTDAALREKRWDELLKEYYKAVSTQTCFDPPNFSVFEKHFAKSALYAYIPCSFFAPMMLSISNGQKYTFDDGDAKESNYRITEEMSLAFGGKNGTLLLRDIVHHLLNKNYIHEFLVSVHNHLQNFTQL